MRVKRTWINANSKKEMEQRKHHLKNISTGIGFLLSPLPVLVSLCPESEPPLAEGDDDEYDHALRLDAVDARRRGPRCVVYAA
jgi:hypothetical protein